MTGLIQGLRRWAFEPIDTAPMAALRIACGLLVLGWALSYLPDAQAFLSNTGLTTGPSGGTPGQWILPVVSPYGIVIVLALAAVALTVGWHTRVVSVLVAFLLIVVQRRDFSVGNGGDLLLRDLALYLTLMPAGETWSLDARRRGSQLRAPWGMRLLQIQLSLVYLFSVNLKISGALWQNGGAVGEALQIGDVLRIALPYPLTTSVTISAFLTYGTLLAESFLVLGLWFPKTRYYAVAVGLGLHLGIEATLLIGWFSLSILSCYFAFIPAHDLRRAVAWGQERWQRSTLAQRRRPPPPPPVRQKRPAPARRPAPSSRQPARRR